MRATLTIDLGIIKGNYNYLETMTKSKVGAAIKSDAYGLGASKVASALFEAGCRDFFVAYIEEAIQVREALPSIDANIYVLNGTNAESTKDFIEYNLTPALSSLWQINLWNKYNPNGKSVIHLDTGMNRFGISVTDFTSLESLPIGLEYIISHLANDSDALNPYNKYQLDRFTKATDGCNIKRSLAASGGIFLGTEYHFDMVRPGAALYGIGSISNPNIKNPVNLTAPIIHLNYCDSYSYIGYSSTAKVRAGSTLATIPIGYADGVFRDWGNKGYVYFDGKKIPIMGTISMDLSILDVTGIDCSIGDKVEIIGPHNTPDQIAPLLGTVAYEIITSLKCGRFHRVYIN